MCEISPPFSSLPPSLLASPQVMGTKPGQCPWVNSLLPTPPFPSSQSLLIPLCLPAFFLPPTFQDNFSNLLILNCIDSRLSNSQSKGLWHLRVKHTPGSSRPPCRLLLSSPCAPCWESSRTKAAARGRRGGGLGTRS